MASTAPSSRTCARSEYTRGVMPPFPGAALGPLGLGVAQSDHVAARVLEIAGRVELRDVAATDDGEAHAIHATGLWRAGACAGKTLIRRARGAERSELNSRRTTVVLVVRAIVAEDRHTRRGGHEALETHLAAHHAMDLGRRRVGRAPLSMSATARAGIRAARTSGRRNGDGARAGNEVVAPACDRSGSADVRERLGQRPRDGCARRRPPRRRNSGSHWRHDPVRAEPLARERVELRRVQEARAGGSTGGGGSMVIASYRWFDRSRKRRPSSTTMRARGERDERGRVGMEEPEGGPARSAPARRPWSRTSHGGTTERRPHAQADDQRVARRRVRWIAARQVRHHLGDRKQRGDALAVDEQMLLPIMPGGDNGRGVVPSGSPSWRVSSPTSDTTSSPAKMIGSDTATIGFGKIDLTLEQHQRRGEPP